MDTFNRLLDAALSVQRYNRRTGRVEPLGEVKVVFRRKTGQWLVSVGKFSSARPDIDEAMEDVIARIEREA